MRNGEYGMRDSTPHPSAGGRSKPRPYGAVVQEIVSAQVLFPNRKTLDEVIAGLLEKIAKLEGTGTDEGE